MEYIVGVLNYKAYARELFSQVLAVFYLNDYEIYLHVLVIIRIKQRREVNEI